jgi:hypothetical protein
MWKSTALTLLATSAIATAAMAGSGFAAYEGKDAIREGQSGTKLQNGGIEFWTTGTPPHRYRILGVMTDSRPATGFGSDFASSGGLVKRIRAIGGDAAIVLNASTDIKGAIALGNGVVGVARDRTTQFLIVHYEDGPGPAMQPLTAQH